MEKQTNTPTVSDLTEEHSQLIKSGLVYWSKHVWKWAPKPSMLNLASDGSIALVGNKGTVFTGNVSELSEVSYGSFGSLNLFFKDGRKFRLVINGTQYSSRPNEQLKQALNSRSDVASAIDAQIDQNFASSSAQYANPLTVVFAAESVSNEFAAARKMAGWAEAFSRFTKVTKSKVNGIKVMLIIAIPVLILIFVLPFILGPLLSK